jgi:lipopolysaccharide/colanic/teichoic acid biosynthesis glycosyltransferase
MIQNLIAWIRKRLGNSFRRSQRDVADNLLGVEQLQHVLECERVRTERIGRPFSLLTLALAEQDRLNGGVPHLASLLRGRLRITDSAGFLGDARIGVVLPETPASGAWSVARDLSAQFELYGEPLACEVHTYPQDDRRRNGSGGNDHRDDRRGHRVARETQSLETLFVQPSPVWKRCLDVTGALVGLALLSPVMLVAALAIKLTSKGPIFFVQQRSGRGGKPFAICKFRTMVVDAEERKGKLLALNEQDGPAFKIKNDPRVTAVGRFLRCTSIDELPQLWNVVKGDMSLVGPRPLPCHESEACLPWQRQRLYVKPGLTCIWQVSGRSQVSFAEWVRMDVRYIRSRTLRHDLKLLVQTVPAVIFRKGAR